MSKKSPPIEVSVSLSYQTSSLVGSGRDREADDYILHMTAEISGYADFEEIEPERRKIVLGELQFYLVRVGNAVNDRVSLSDVFDTLQETCEAGAAIFDSCYSDFSPAVKRNFGEAFWGGDLLLLHYLTVEPCARGQRLGLAVLERVVRDWSSGCSLVAMKPFPLQFQAVSDKPAHQKQLALDRFPSSKREAFRALRRYYEKLGFERIGRSEYYGVCPSEARAETEHLQFLDHISLPLEVINCLTGPTTDLAQRHGDGNE